MGVAISYSNIEFGASQTVPAFTQPTSSPIDLLGFSRQLLDAAELADIHYSCR